MGTKVGPAENEKYFGATFPVAQTAKAETNNFPRTDFSQYIYVRTL
jgi:hypothetical protein